MYAAGTVPFFLKPRRWLSQVFAGVGGFYFVTQDVSKGTSIHRLLRLWQKDAKTLIYPIVTRNPASTSFRFFRGQGPVSTSVTLKPRKRPESRWKRRKDRSQPMLTPPFRLHPSCMRCPCRCLWNLVSGLFRVETYCPSPHANLREKTGMTMRRAGRRVGSLASRKGIVGLPRRQVRAETCQDHYHGLGIPAECLNIRDERNALGLPGNSTRNPVLPTHPFFCPRGAGIMPTLTAVNFFNNRNVAVKHPVIYNAWIGG